MEMDTELRLSPAWRHALSVLLSQGLPNGKILRKDDIAELFGLSRPETIEQHERFQLDFLRQFATLRDELLEEHRIALRTIYGEQAWEVVPPSVQTDLAIGEGMRDMRRSLRKMTRTLAFIRHEELTSEESKKNADAQAKAAMLAGMIRTPLLEKKG